MVVRLQCVIDLFPCSPTGNHASEQKLKVVKG